MSFQDIGKIGNKTFLIGATALVANKVVGLKTRNVIIQNFSTTDAVFVNTGKAGGSLVFPVQDAAGEEGTLIGPGAKETFQKNDETTDDTVYYICAAGKSVIIGLQASNGE